MYAVKSTEKTIFDYLEDPKATAALPSLRLLLSELESLTEKSNVRLDEVTKLVQIDQGMSLRVLRIANSAYYAPTEPIMDVGSAVLYIGLSIFRESVVAARCIEETCHLQQNILNWKEFWIHAAGVGRIMMELVSHLRNPELSEESFYLMGLLHDIGKVVLVQLMPKEFDKIYTQAAAEKITPDKLEMDVLGVSHGHLGAWYMQKQGIPLALSEPVRFHHAAVLDDNPHSKHAVLISLADKIAHSIALGQSGNKAESGDIFSSMEWKWYVKQCYTLEEEGEQLREEILSRLDLIADLVRKQLL